MGRLYPKAIRILTMRVMKIHEGDGPDGRNCGRLASDQVTNENTSPAIHCVLSFVT